MDESFALGVVIGTWLLVVAIFFLVVILGTVIADWVEKHL